MRVDDRAILEQLAEADLLAVTAFLEARGEPVWGLIAVMWTVLNRMHHRQCGRTVSEVCLWPLQFSCWNDRDPNQALGLSIARRLVTGESLVGLPDAIVLATCQFLAARVLSDPPRVADPTHGATHYFAPRRVARIPEWADPEGGAEPTVTIGAHQFYRHVA